MTIRKLYTSEKLVRVKFSYWGATLISYKGPPHRELNGLLLSSLHLNHAIIGPSCQHLAYVPMEETIVPLCADTLQRKPAMPLDTPRSPRDQQHDESMHDQCSSESS